MKIWLSTRLNYHSLNYLLGYFFFLFAHYFSSQGFNATMTVQVDTPGRRGHDQIKEMKLRLHPDMGKTLSVLSKDPKTTIVVLSGSERNVLDEV